MRTDVVTAQAITISVRRASKADDAFLHELYADRRAPELGALGWGAAEQRAFVDMQFRAQQSGYGAAYPEADHWIPCVGGDAAGRLLVDRSGDPITIVDLVVLSRYRGLGIGTALVEQVLADARTAGRRVGLMVAAHDRRLVGWYERLGFAEVDRRGTHVEMEAGRAGVDGS